MQSPSHATGGSRLPGKTATLATLTWRTTMAAKRSLRSPERPRVHPGAVLREDVLPAFQKTKQEIANLLGVSRQTVYAILTERQPVTPAMALRIGKLTGTTAESWL